MSRVHPPREGTIWLTHLRDNPAATQDYLAWVTKRRDDAQRAVNDAETWEATLAAKALLKCRDDDLKVLTNQLREERQHARRRADRHGT